MMNLEHITRSWKSLLPTGGRGSAAAAGGEAAAAAKIKGLCKIYKGHKEWLSMFPTFLLQLSEGKYNVGGGSISSKSTL